MSGPNPSTPAGIFYSIVWSAWVKLLVVRVLGMLAIGASSAGGIILTFIIGWVTDEFFTVMAMFVDMGVIQLTNAIHQAAFSTASETLAIVSKEYGNGSPQYEAQHAKEQAAFYNLITFNSDPLGVDT